MKTVAKSKLKARMLEYFREVERSGEPLVVTDHGREVLEVRPIVRRSSMAEALTEYRSDPGTGCAGPATEEIVAPSPADDGQTTRRSRRSNLDKYAGDSDFGPDWDKEMEVFDQIDPELWS